MRALGLRIGLLAVSFCGCEGVSPPLAGDWEGTASGSELLAPLHAVAHFDARSTGGTVHMVFDAPRGTSGDGCLSTITLEASWSALRETSSWSLELAGTARTQIAGCTEPLLERDVTETYHWGPFTATFADQGLTLVQQTATPEQTPLRIVLQRR